MPSLQLNSVVLICIYVAAFIHISLQSNDEIRSVKKDLKITATSEATHLSELTNRSPSANLTSDVNSQHNLTKMNARIFQKNLDIEIPDSFKVGFYFFIGLSIAAILLILVKTYKMRMRSRAERNYGVHGDRTTQELTPLPMAIEEDSDNEDHTLFDINRQIRVS